MGCRRSEPSVPRPASDRLCCSGLTSIDLWKNDGRRPRQSDSGPVKLCFWSEVKDLVGPSTELITKRKKHARMREKWVRQNLRPHPRFGHARNAGWLFPILGHVRVVAAKGFYFVWAKLSQGTPRANAPTFIHTLSTTPTLV